MNKNRLAFLLGLLVFASASAWAESIDLNALPFYVRGGFDMSWTRSEPSPSDPEWAFVPGRAGGRPLVVRDLDLPGLEDLPAIRALPAEPRTFCFVTAFEADDALLDSPSGIGLYLSAIGEDWEVYLNGSVVRSEVYLRKDGSIAQERALRGTLVNIDKRFIRPGKNILAFMIIGDPASERTGLSSDGRYLIAPYKRLLGLRSENLDLMLIGIYFFFALYHIWLYALRPSNRSYLYFGLGTLALSFYLLSRTYLISELIPDTAVLRSLEYAFLFLLFPLFLAFFDLLARKKISRFAFRYGALSLAAALLVPFVFQDLLFQVWRLSLFLPTLYLLVFDVAKPLAGACSAECARRSAFNAGAKLRAAGRVLVGTDIGRISIGLVFIVAAVGIDLARLSFLRGPVFSKYGFLILVFGSAATLASQYHRLYDEIESLAAGLEDKVKERTSDLEAAIGVQSNLNARLSAANLRLQNAMDIAEKDMRMAVHVQQGFFPAKAPALDDWDIAFIARPVSGVSGDFYDFYVEDRALRGLVVGDVSGHGIASGLVTILARSVFWRNFNTLSSHSLGRVLEQINEELSAELSSVENYLTCALLRFEENVVEYVNAAHPELAYRRAGTVKASLLVPRSVDDYKGPPLGREGIEAPYRAVKFPLGKGDSLLLYTDCLAEARNENGEHFGVEGLITAYGRAPEGKASDMLDYILDEWRYHIGTIQPVDDMTVVLLRRK
ncbi:MAG TPA: PP2C family protein-serine/threonine phosphatase [Rectinemataceae bacterium]|nr:PP2C family protein-serine/threonine phosphatase [Rectinemataceae bacterium]